MLPHVMLCLAADDRPALVEALRRFRARSASDRVAALMGDGPAPRGRERVAIVGPVEALETRLDLAMARLSTAAGPRVVSRADGLYATRDAAPGRLAFLFPGQGSEHVGMLQGLADRVPSVHNWFDALDRAAVAAGDTPSTARIWPTGAGDVCPGLHEIGHSGLLGTVASLAMHEVLGRLGLRADVHVGHSNGEHPAVFAAGMVSGSVSDWCDGFVRVARSGAALPGPRQPEALLAVGALPRARVEQCLDGCQGAVFVAMDNSPHQFVVGGRAAEVDVVATRLAAQGAILIRLPFARAFHTPLFEDWAAAFGDYYAALPMVAGHVPLVSCLTSEALPADADARKAQMRAQWTTTVHFRRTIERLHAEGVGTFVEVGPHKRLTAFVADTLRGRPHLAVSAAATNGDDLEHLWHALAELFAHGVPIEPRRLFALTPDAVVRDHETGAPSREDFTWRGAAAVHERLAAAARAQLSRAAALVNSVVAQAGPMMPAGTAIPTGSSGAGEPWAFLGRQTRRSSRQQIYRRVFERQADPFVDDHALGRRDDRHGDAGYPLPVLPFTVSAAIAAEAASTLAEEPVCRLSDLRASRWLALDLGRLVVEVSCERDSNVVAVRLSDAAAASARAAFESRAHIGAVSGADARGDVDLGLGVLRRPRTWTIERFYRDYAFHGPSFQGLSQIHGVGEAGIDAEIRVTQIPGVATTRMIVDPAMLDCAGQLVAFWLLEHRRHAPTFGIFPFAAARLDVLHPPLPPGSLVRCQARIALKGATTVATVAFDTIDGRPIARLGGFAQRLIEVPSGIAGRVFGGNLAAPLTPADRGAMAANWGIWERALAHLALAPDELRAWSRIPSADGARLAWLLTRLTPDPVTGRADVL